jgi:DNA-binding NarL/FixJ family response regulator
MTTVALVEDNKDLRDILNIAFSEHPGEFEFLKSFSDAESALEEIPVLKPEVVLMDINLPGMTGIECMKALKILMPSLNVIMLTVFAEDKTVFDSLCYGACGYITKNATPEQIMDAVREVKRGGAPMSPRIARMVVNSFNNNFAASLTGREIEVLGLLSQGKSYKMVADLLFVTHDTVRFHIKNIYKKLEVHSLHEAIAKTKKNVF